MAVFPYELGFRIRSECVDAGVDRIVELGMNNVFRVGSAHDGMFPTQRLVRFVSMDLPSDDRVKGMALRIDQTEFLEQDRFVEFIP